VRALQGHEADYHVRAFITVGCVASQTDEEHRVISGFFIEKFLMHRRAWRELLVLRPGKEGIGLAHQPVDNEADPLLHSRVEVVQGLGARSES
jgi:hypothetical protein